MARRTATGDLRPEAINRVYRVRMESLRAEGRYQELMLWLIGEPEPWQLEPDGVTVSRVHRSRPDIEPTIEDLAGALREAPTEPLPAPIREWMIARDLLKTDPRKRGTKTSSRSIQDDDQLVEIYCSEYFAELEAYAAREAPPDTQTAAPGVASRAKKRAVKTSGWSSGTIDDALAARRLLKPLPK